MKKFCSVLLASALVAAAAPAIAFENQFGGEFRVRSYSQQGFAGDKAQDLIQTDTRTRLFYTAVFNDKFKLVNKFEMGDMTWGQQDDKTAVGKDSYGDIGADGISVEVKNTYVDFTPVDNLNFKIGTQNSGKIYRGFLFWDDFSGATVTYDAGMAKIPFIWMKNYEGGIGKDKNQMDYDFYTLNPVINISKEFSVNPLAMYAFQEETDSKVYYLGLNLEMKTSAFNAWGLGLYEGGEAKVDPSVVASKTADVKAYLLAAGGEVNLGKAAIHGQGFYASGQDAKSKDIENFFVPVVRNATGYTKGGDNSITNKGQYYTWAEIMGHGDYFDNQDPYNAPGEKISNVSALNAGASFKAMDKLTLVGDVWWAKRNEKTGKMYNGKLLGTDLGTEVDLRATYKIFENLDLDVLGCYLFAGNGISDGHTDPVEVGTRLILTF